MSKTKLYIDCQFFQTAAWDRGMGRYTMSLIKTLYEIAPDTEYCLIFSSALPSKPEMTRAVADLCPKATCVELDLQSTLKLDYNQAAKHNKEVLNAYLGSQNATESRSVFMIPCLFQEPTASIFPDDVEKCLLYYDAIPLLYYKRYRGAINYDNYMERHSTLYEADKIFTISQTIADDLAIYYGMKNDGEHVINIDGACIDGMFETFTKPKITLPKHYVLFPTSDDIRKNNRAAVQAFEQLRELTKIDYKLVITSSFRDAAREELTKLADDIIFTGNVTDAELAWLYKNTEVVLFTSEYEGLGLPVLEAVKMGKKIACSNIPVFREISEEAFYFFDPLDIENISLTLYQAIQGKDWADKQALYEGINERYTWARSAGIVRDAIDAFSAKTDIVQIKKPKIAVLCPSPDGYSAIGKVVQELHAATAKYFDVHYYFENRKDEKKVHVRPKFLSYLVPCFEVEDFNALTYRDYDAVIYHIGNSEYHFNTILNALYLPGIAIFHDTILREAFGEMARLGFISMPRLDAETRLDAQLGETKTAFLGSLAHNQIAGVTHSKYAQQAIAPLAADGVEIIKAELPTALPAQNVQLQHRDVVHVGLAGILSSHKGLEIIQELALDQDLAERTVLHVFGFDFVDPDAIEELRTYKNVRLTTNLSDLEYQMQLAGLDILVNYRSSYRGETSLTVLEAMRYGCVILVNGELGWFAELPDDSVVKVYNPLELSDTVRHLVSSPQTRKRIGNAAKKYVGTTHDPETYVQQLVRLVEDTKSTINRQRAEAIKKAHSVDDVLERYKKIGKGASK